MAKDDGSVAGVSKDELAGLSEEERAALAEGEGQDQDDVDALKEIAGDGEDTQEGGDGEDEGDAGDDEGEEGEAEAEDKDGGEKPDQKKEAAKDGQDTAKGAKGDDTVQGAGADDAGNDEPPEVVTPRYVAPPVKDYAEQVGVINAEEGKLLADYKAGDIEDADFFAKKADIQGRRDDLLARKLKGEFSAEFNEQMAAQQWQFEVQHFMRQAKREGVDYNAAENKEAKAALDRAVKVLADDPANTEKDGEWFLSEAHEIVKGRFKLGVPANNSSDDKGEKPGAKDGKKASRKPDLKTVPKTLGGLPAVTDTDTGGTDPEFAGLDKLDGMELETAVAKMSPAQQDRWARSR